MQQPAVTSSGPNGMEQRAEVLFVRHRLSILRRTDHLFAALMVFQWLAGIVVALLISPRAGAGATSQVHVHVWAAMFLGGAIASLPITLALVRPGQTSTRHV